MTFQDAILFGMKASIMMSVLAIGLDTTLGEASYLFRRLAPRQALANISVYAACTRRAAICSRTGAVPRPHWQRKYGVLQAICRVLATCFCW